MEQQPTKDTPKGKVLFRHLIQRGRRKLENLSFCVEYWLCALTDFGKIKEVFPDHTYSNNYCHYHFSFDPMIKHKCIYLFAFFHSLCRWGGEDGPQTCGDCSKNHTETLRSRKHGQHSFLGHVTMGLKQEQKTTDIGMFDINSIYDKHYHVYLCQCLEHCSVMDQTQNFNVSEYPVMAV